jgi:DNA repair exonuclease SbcCD ATPase subunit
MPNRRLTTDELARVNELLARIRAELGELSGGDTELLFAYRRKVYKELTYDERSRPAVRRRLKAAKLHEQSGLCPICWEPLPTTYTVLDRFSAADGYTSENTRLIHQHCDRRVQAERGYA